MKICVADDEKEVRESIIYKLKTLFPEEQLFDVQFGRLALEQIETVQPDLVFLDIRMPEIDGLEILRAIKRTCPGAHVAILSGYDDFGYARRALQLGAIDYLLKPADREQLREIVESVKSDMEKTLRKEIEGDLAKLSDQYVFIHDIQCFNTSLWFDERQAKEIVFGDPHAEEWHKRRESMRQQTLMSFAVNHDYEGIALYAPSGNNGLFFRRKQEFLPALLHGMNQWESRRFFSGDPEWPAKSEPMRKETAKQAAGLRQQILSFAKIGDEQRLEASLNAWLVCLREMKFASLKKECVNLMALLDEGLVKQEVIVLEEEKMHYWSQWAAKHKTWDELQAKIRKFVLGGVRTWMLLEQQTGSGWFEHALRLVDASRDPNISLESVAEAVGVHPVTLSRMFKQQTGINFVKYLVRSRLKRAQSMLLTTDKNINGIADEIGYVDHRYFRGLFKREFGLTPSEYRKTNGIMAVTDDAEDQA
ncbi:response regulator transcription factor [Paenibacillus abyssi]|uniref:DNA-binding response regulator n=1 Tax=Paenibacillus abyssi TaxID=1340531 RepID=A0A917FVT1_9BACL|nr:helix-turn-helix domain-containing protein [Paenibacillus abyssi]GGG05988.1 hypothetical protein GCM10010916_23760 [Paenibacillus abyssi]